MKPSFDTWTIVFAVAAVQAFFTAIVLLRWKKGSPTGNRLLAALLGLFGYTLIEYVLYWTHYLQFFPFLMDITSVLPFLFGPILWLYLRHVFTGTKPNWYDTLHLIPFVIALGIMSPWYLTSGSEKIHIAQNGLQLPIYRPLMRFLMWGRMLHLLLYAVGMFRYTYTQPVVAYTRKWGWWLCGSFMGFTLAFISYFVLIRFPFFNLAWDYHISATMTFFIYLIAYAGYTQQAVFDGYDWKTPHHLTKYKNSGLTEEASNRLLAKLQALMQEERLYRQSEINLDTLSARLNASKHHVSQVINTHLGANFFEYINHLRIQEAIHLLEQTNRQQMHIIEVAYAVGFNNKVSFNQSFRKTTGMTPSEYRKSHHRSDSGQHIPSAVSNSQ